MIGAALATTVFVAVLLGGHASLLQRPQGAAEFFDAQAHSLLAGHWDVPQQSLEIEGFVLHGKTYEYFGPLPALLRLPVAAITDELDGRLGQISMILAFVVAMTAVIRIVTRIRPLVRGDDPPTRAEAWATGGFVFVVGAGSVFTFLASRAWAYHESELWGAALALLAFDAIVRYTVEPTRGRLVLASGCTLFALLARGSVGLGPILALGLVLVMGLWAWSRRLTGLAPSGVRTWAERAVAVLVPVAAYAYVNAAKFGTLFSLPFRTQVSTHLFRSNRVILAANGGSMFNAALIPTGLRQYLASRPLELTPLFPWIGFPPRPHTIGHQTISWTPTSSFPAVMPLLAVLAVVGLVAVIRPGAGLRPSTVVLRIPVAAAAIATVPTLAYAYVAQRYLSDFMPLAVLLAAAGVHRTLRWTSRGTHRARRVAAVGGLVLLGVLSLWFNIGLAVLDGRLLNSAVLPHDRAAFVSFQSDLHHRLVGGSMPNVFRGTRLPDARASALFAFPGCRALYWSDGESWQVIEPGEASGEFRLRVRFPDQPTGWQPFVVVRDAQHPHRKPQFVAVRTLMDHRVQFAYRALIPEDPITIDPGKVHHVEVTMSRPNTSFPDSQIRVTVDGKPAFASSLPNPIIGEKLPASPRFTVGAGHVPGIEPRFTGTVTHRPISAPLCRKVTAGR